MADPEDAARGVLEDARHDLAERERHDRQVVATQPERRGAEDHAPARREHRGDDQDEEEVDVDPRDVRAERALDRGQDVDALAVVDRPELLGAQPAHDEGADGEERDVAEVEQTGEADDDVQAQRHDHVGQGLDRRVEQVVRRGHQRVEDVRVGEREPDEDQGPGPVGHDAPDARDVAAQAGDRVLIASAPVGSGHAAGERGARSSLSRLLAEEALRPEHHHQDQDREDDRGGPHLAEVRCRRSTG